MHVDRYLVKTVLKDILKFREGIDMITYPPHSNYTESVLKGISAGIDMIMVPYNHTEFINIVIDLVNNNYISTDRIDDVVKRILRVKFTLGLFETPLAEETLVDQLGSQRFGKGSCEEVTCVVEEWRECRCSSSTPP